YTTSTINLTATGNEPSEFDINVVISTEYCGNANDDVTIYLVPDATLDSATHICADESVTLAPGGGSNATYAWNSGETTSTLDAGSAGVYSVTKMEEGCESMATVVVSQSQAVEIADIEGCEDDAPLSVDATIADGSSYAWTGGSSTSAASNDFSTSGSYSVTATDVHGCVSTSDFDLLVLGAPDADIAYTGSAGTAFLFSSAGSSNTSPNTTYLWTFNALDTSSAANPTYVFPWNGNPTTYPVSLVIDNGCGQDPAEISITVDPLSVNDINTVDFAVYPNPTSDILNIALGSEVNDAGLVEIMDITGRILNAERVASGQSIATIDLSELASGSYLIKVSVDGKSSVTSVVKQ
ncbi:T9SS type A sorting domain-containing protein, partial [Salibacteraceae bacterium]|nr:T9SS type A sorting domain-containing protein [Salibacteraceae bacterium]